MKGAESAIILQSGPALVYEISAKARLRPELCLAASWLAVIKRSSLSFSRLYAPRTQTSVLVGAEASRCGSLMLYLRMRHFASLTGLTQYLCSRQLILLPRHCKPNGNEQLRMSIVFKRLTLILQSNLDVQNQHHKMFQWASRQGKGSQAHTRTTAGIMQL